MGSIDARAVPCSKPRYDFLLVDPFEVVLQQVVDEIVVDVAVSMREMVSKIRPPPTASRPFQTRWRTAYWARQLGPTEGNRVGSGPRTVTFRGRLPHRHT